MWSLVGYGITLPNYIAGGGGSELLRLLGSRCGAQLLVEEGGCIGVNYGDSRDYICAETTDSDRITDGQGEG